MALRCFFLNWPSLISPTSEKAQTIINPYATWSSVLYVGMRFFVRNLSRSVLADARSFAMEMFVVSSLVNTMSHCSGTETRATAKDSSIGGAKVMIEANSSSVADVANSIR